MDVVWLPSRSASQKDAQPVLLQLTRYPSSSFATGPLIGQLDAAPNNGAHGRRPYGDYAKAL
jgi:hypothetical protein